MSDTYDPQAIEQHWQSQWAANQRDTIDLDGAEHPFYNLMEFPYPSGEGLHVGHVFSFGGADTYGRFLRRRGYTVFQPMGFDAFGIHSENYALKVGAHPAELTRHSVARFREQLQRLGAAFDWSRTLDTTSPEYYRWTQWVFVQLYRAGLAYRAAAAVNWCPACATVLANEQVIDGRCERCDTPMQRREMTQWFLRITAYAERLLDYRGVQFDEAIIKRQQAWIGRSEGNEIEFTLDQTPSDSVNRHVVVFSTRPDTITHVTFVALALEHPLVAEVMAQGGARGAAVGAFVEQARGRLDLERQQGEPGGVFTGLEATNPYTGARVPVWVADYVLGSYGTGAIMGVPAHDERDARFAARYGLALDTGAVQHNPETDWASTIGQRVTRYRLRDWLISRQRYWGPPIPIVYCDVCGTLPVPEEQLPVLLPPLEQFRPTGTGVAPLATVESFVNTTCPQCGGPAQRETDVSDNFLDSAWYYLRYLSTDCSAVPWNRARLEHWLPVNLYTGGPEHATMHHLYARFIAMALYDQGLLPVAEPFARLRLHGTITRAGRKMSKSRGNVVNPDVYISQYGVDATRMALLFLGPFDSDADFSDRGVAGMVRFLRRVWAMCVADRRPSTDDGRLFDDQHVLKQNVAMGEGPSAVREQWSVAVNQVIQRVTDDIEAYQFHTAIAALMEYSNWLRTAGVALPQAEVMAARRTLVLLLAPFAPHISEELWLRLGGSGSVHDQPWPVAQAAVAGVLSLPVQINGRVRDRIQVPADASEQAIQTAALAAPAIRSAITNATIQRIVCVPGRVVNIVIREG